MKAFNEAFPDGIQSYDDAVRYLTHFHGFAFQPGEDPEKVTFASQYVNFTVSPDQVMVMAREYYSDGQREAEEVQTTLHALEEGPAAEGQEFRYYILAGVVATLLLVGAFLVFRFFSGA